MREVSRSCRNFLPRLTDSSARRTGCDYNETWSALAINDDKISVPKPTANHCGVKKKSDRRSAYYGCRMREMRKQKKRRLTCSFRFCGREATHWSTRFLTFSTSTSITPSPDTMATICKYSAMAEGDETRVSSSRPVIVVSTCSFFIFSFL